MSAQYRTPAKSEKAATANTITMIEAVAMSMSRSQYGHPALTAKTGFDPYQISSAPAFALANGGACVDLQLPGTVGDWSSHLLDARKPYQIGVHAMHSG
jgi:hypothetical protein